MFPDPSDPLTFPPPAGGVLGAGGDTALLAERRCHLPATG